MLQQHTQPSEARIAPLQPSEGDRAWGRSLFDPRAALGRAYATNRSLTLLGVVMLAAGQAALPCATYTPQQVKGAVCGSGRAEIGRASCRERV